MASRKAYIHKEPLVPCLDVARTTWKQISAPLLARQGSSRGLTLVEILVVLTLFLIVGATALLVSMDTYRGTSFRSDRDLLVALLQHARIQSINNICAGSGCKDGKAHGVHIDQSAHTFTAFQGVTYASRDISQDQAFNENPTTVATGATDIIFTQLTGVSNAQLITLTANGKTSVITIDTSGRIAWTN